MTINTKEFSLKAELNKAGANAIADQLKKLQFGSLLLAVPTTLRKKAAAAAAGTLAANFAVVLPDDAKAAVISTAYARAGSFTGPLTVVDSSATVASGQIRVGYNGNIETLAADVITDLDVLYTPEKGDVVELKLPVVSNSAALPATWVAAGAVLLEEVNVTVGTVVGKKVILAPSGSAPATGQARFDLAKANVKLASADAATEVVVKVLLAAGVDSQALLVAETIIAS